MTTEIEAMVRSERVSLRPSWRYHTHFDGAMKVLQVWVPLPFGRTLNVEIEHY